MKPLFHTKVSIDLYDSLVLFSASKLQYNEILIETK